MSILALICICVGSTLVVGVLSIWRHERNRRRDRQREIDTYRAGVLDRLRIPTRQPHPQAQDETRQLPALTIRNALDHIHTPTPTGTPSQGHHMTVVTFPNDRPAQPAEGPAEMGGLPTLAPEAPSYSINDFAKWREQDQTIAQLASQLANMHGDPWTVHELEPVKAAPPTSSEFWVGNWYDERNHPVLNVANQLNRLSAPIATFREERDAGAAGKAFRVYVGSKAVEVETAKVGAALTDQINADQIILTAPIRKRALADLKEFATSGLLPVAAASRQWLCKCTQNAAIYCDTKVEAQEYADKLNAAYHAAKANSYSLILKELGEVTDPAVGATLSHSIGENDRKLADFRTGQRIAGA